MLQLHVRLCLFCGKFNRQVMDHQDMCRHYREQEADAAPLIGMGADQKQALKELLAAQSAGKLAEQSVEQSTADKR